MFAVAIYFGFAKDIPFTHDFRVKAVFESSNSIRKNSPVRIAGVNVGRVTGVHHLPHGQSGTVVTMEVQDKGLPIHSDATVKVRPRIFLEGNFFVELQPGSPSADELDSGSTIGMTQTDGPVQIDQVLTTLQRDQRGNLQKLLQGYGAAIYADPAP